MNKGVLARPAQLRKSEDAYKNTIFLSQKFLAQLAPKRAPLLQIKGFVFQYTIDDDFGQALGMNKLARQTLRVGMTDTMEVRPKTLGPEEPILLSQIVIQLQLPINDKDIQEIDDTLLRKELLAHFKDFVVNGSQTLLYLFDKTQLYLNIISVRKADLGVGSSTGQYGKLYQETDIELRVREGSKLKLKSQGLTGKSLFRPDFKFEDMKIGGLDNQLANIFRRAFASRRFPPAVIQKYGIKHIKGMLLYGPPGTGKTLIARQLSKALKAKQPVIVNGPQIFSKFVGESEENVRKLFKPAEADSKNLGDQSPLHVIVFDEIDAICKQRGSVNSGTNTHDTVVNQLLTKIDGVESLNNVLVIGMTNRKDLIDEAILRPGRFQVHIEVGLPDEAGRQAIFRIHSEAMIKNKILGDDVDFPALAKEARNYTGAEIEAVVKSATSFAMARAHNLTDFSKAITIDKDHKVDMSDFEMALTEVKPMFGLDSEQLEVYVRNPLIDYGQRFGRITKIFENAFAQVRNGKSTQLSTILLEGESGCGSTSIAAWAAHSCGFPFVKFISPEQYVGYSESSKIQAIVKVFEDAYRSKYSCVVLDSLERLIQWVEVGLRFNNVMLQTLLVLIKKLPRKAENRILIVATTGLSEQLARMDLPQSFSIRVGVPTLNEQLGEISGVLKTLRLGGKDWEGKGLARFANELGRCPIKKLLAAADMLGREPDSHKVNEVIDTFNFH